jgi:hypothetical protein
MRDLSISGEPELLQILLQKVEGNSVSEPPLQMREHIFYWLLLMLRGLSLLS